MPQNTKLRTDKNNVQYVSLNRYSEEQRTRGTHSDNTQEEPDRVLFFTKFGDLKLSQLRYSAFLFIGISILWPWNSFLSASSYYIQKFGQGSKLSDNYSSTMMTVSTLTSLIFNSYLSTKQFANFVTRIKNGSIINFIVFGLLALSESLFPQVKSVGYFIFLLSLVFFSSLGTCLQQNGCMALVNVLGPRYAQAVMVGQAIAGVLPSVSLIATNLIYYGDDKEPDTKSIVLYFASTSAITLFAGGLFLITNRFENEIPIEDVETNEDLSSTSIVPPPTQYVPFLTLLKKLKFIVFAIFTVFLVSLVFPIFAFKISSVNHHGRFTSDSIYIPFTFFIWNLGDLAGRVACAYPIFVLNSDLKVFLYSIVRFGILPLFFLCQLKPGQAKINSDFFYLSLQFWYGFTNGHCLSSSFMNVGKYVDDSEKEAAGGFTTVFLSLGLLFGSLFSYVFVKILS